MESSKYWLIKLTLGCDEMLDDGSQRQAGQKVERPHEQHRAEKQNDEGKSSHRKSSGTGGGNFLAPERTGHGHDRNNHPETADQHGQADRRVVPRSVRAQSGEGTAVVAIGGTERVENLAESMRSVVVQSGQTPLADGGPGGKAQN